MLHGLLVGLCAGAIVASGTTLLLVVHFGLRPVVRVSDQIAALSETELSSRITETGLPAELRPMVERLNGLLQRLAAAFERERAFTADVAHELRTPLSALLTTLDVCRSRPRTSAEYEASLDKSRDLTQRLKSMVQNLLTMARAEAGQLTRSHTSVELCQLLHECWSPFQERAEMRKLQVQWTKPTACPIETDSDKLRIVLTNLLDNAVSYANDDGTITVAILQRAQGPVEIEVANTGNQIPAENMPQVFERFWRSDSSRSETGVHCGLGLSLCLRLSKVMGIGLQAETRPPDWFVVSLSIPGGDHNFGK
jgi:signal transduction histidine kinase